MSRARIAGVTVLALVPVALGSGACASSDEPSSVHETVVTAATVDAVVDTAAALEASIRIEAAGCVPTVRNGIGTAVSEDLLVTAAHVVAGADTVDVVDAAGDRHAAVVVAFDPLLDIAALRVDEAVGLPVPIRPDRAGAGETGAVVIVGDASLEVTDVSVIRRAAIETTDIYREAEVTRAGFEIEATIRPGDSGTAVHLPGGIVGIVWARSTVNADRAWAVDLPDRFLDDAGATRSPVDTGSCP